MANTVTQPDVFGLQAAVRREVLRIMDENRETILRRACVPPRAVIAVEPAPEVQEQASIAYDRLYTVIEIQLP